VEEAERLDVRRGVVEVVEVSVIVPVGVLEGVVLGQELGDTEKEEDGVLNHVALAEGDGVFEEVPV